MCSSFAAYVQTSFPPGETRMGLALALCTQHSKRRAFYRPYVLERPLWVESDGWAVNLLRRDNLNVAGCGNRYRPARVRRTISLR